MRSTNSVQLNKAEDMESDKTIKTWNRKTNCKFLIKMKEKIIWRRNRDKNQ